MIICSQSLYEWIRSEGILLTAGIRFHKKAAMKKMTPSLNTILHRLEYPGVRRSPRILRSLSSTCRTHKGSHTYVNTKTIKSKDLHKITLDADRQANDNSHGIKIYEVQEHSARIEKNTGPRRRIPIWDNLRANLSYMENLILFKTHRCHCMQQAPPMSHGHDDEGDCYPRKAVPNSDGTNHEQRRGSSNSTSANKLV